MHFQTRQQKSSLHLHLNNPMCLNYLQTELPMIIDGKFVLRIPLNLALLARMEPIFPEFSGKGGEAITLHSSPPFRNFQ